MRPTTSLYITPNVDYKDKLYKIKRLVRYNPDENINFWKSIIKHDLILKKDGFLWFLDEIIDVEIIEE
jgi:hypothetical protein